MSNILFCVTGPSGSGKTTIMKNIMDNEVGSCTTRIMRKGEVQGREYLFLNRIEFEWLLNEGMLAEWTEYSGNFYGTTLEELHNKLSKGHAYVICDNHGFKQFREAHDNVVSIFLYAEEKDCINNMVGRGDTLGNIESRLITYENEIANSGQYDYVVKNIRGCQHITENILEYIIRAEIHKFVKEATE